VIAALSSNMSILTIQKVLGVVNRLALQTIKTRGSQLV
jgi:hypothetical protein